MKKTMQKPNSNRHRQKNGQSARNSYYWWPITHKKIKQAVQRVVKAINPEKVILFGSFAYGKPTPDSDVDLLVIMESRKNVHERVIEISEILYPRPFPVDIIVRTPTEVSERLKIGDGFFHEILVLQR